MPNPLTGDFEAVLQVSGATLNRLAASMHQNDRANASVPTLPHSAVLRIDGRGTAGVRGVVWAQIGVPRIELIHGSSDQFTLEIGVRARFKKDSGSQQFPEFINGTVRATYRFEAIDPNCRGWRQNASEYVWIRVIGDSVTFRGTAVDDVNILTVAPPLDENVVNAKITALISMLLRTKFEATPHRVSKRFRRGAMRSLHVGVNRSVVAVPIGLVGDPTAGRIDSIDQDILGPTDFGIAISREYLLSKIQPRLDEVKATFSRDFGYSYKNYLDLGPAGDVDVVTVTITWRATLKSATASWTGGYDPLLGISVGLVTIKVSGQALTQKKPLNITFDVTQLVSVTFDDSTEAFVVTAIGAPVIALFGTFASIAEPYAKPEITKAIKPELQAALAQIRGELDLAAKKVELVNQVRTIDDQANAHFDEGVFSPDGIIARGRIFLSPRRKAVNVFTKTEEQDGYSAFQSWIPGGRIDRFDWSWAWFNNAGDPGTEVEQDRFLLRRPIGGGQGRFGVMLGLHRPLPGLDGSGRVCLSLSGAQVHPYSGDAVPVSSGRQCHRFGFDVRVGLATGNLGRLFIREWHPPENPGDPPREIGLVEVGGRHPGKSGSNTLVVFVDEWSERTAESLREGLASCARLDAGLFVLVLFRDGMLSRAGADVRRELARLASSLEAPMLVNEDVRGSWSAVLSTRSGAGPRWRLISPTGGLTWRHDGDVSRDVLGRALSDYLFPSPPAVIEPLRPGLSLGERISASDFNLWTSIVEDSPCPPPPFGRLGLESMVTFVQRGSMASDSAIRRVREGSEGDRNDTFVAVVVDGADDAALEGISGGLPRDAVAIADPHGTIARRFGVRVWPTTVMLNEHGLVTGFDMGADPRLRGQGEDHV